MNFDWPKTNRGAGRTRQNVESYEGSFCGFLLAVSHHHIKEYERRDPLGGPVCLCTISNHGRMPGLTQDCHIASGVGSFEPDAPMLADQFHDLIGPGKNRKLKYECLTGREYFLACDLVTREQFPAPVIGQDEEFFFA
jgi:hypothetical protein